MIFRFLPYLGGLLLFAAFCFGSYLVYRYVTRDERMLPKRALASRNDKLTTEVKEADLLLEKLVEHAKISQQAEPLLADMVIAHITNYKSERRKRSITLYKEFNQ